MDATAPSLTEALGIQTEVLMLIWQAFYRLSHFPSIFFKPAEPFCQPHSLHFTELYQEKKVLKTLAIGHFLNEGPIGSLKLYDRAAALIR